jgi:amidase
MARSAEDLRLALDVMTGPASDYARAWSLALTPPRRSQLNDYRVAAWLDEPGFEVDPAVGERLRATVRALREAGVTVDEDARPALRLAEVLDVYLRLLWPILLSGSPPEQFAELGKLAQTFPEDTADHAARMARYATQTHRDWLGANEVRERMRAAAAEFFERYDVLLTPVNQVPAIAHDDSEPQAARILRWGGKEHPYYDLMTWIALATALRLPATAAPAGRTPEGLPVGIQIIGPHLEDRTTIDFAARLAEVAGGFVAPPGFAR